MSPGVGTPRRAGSGPSSPRGKPPGILGNPQLRYSRHIALYEFGPNEARIHGGCVAVIGAGGIASSCIMYLAAAGVGKLVLIDYDRVSTSNLQRQVIHAEESVGRNKAESAAEMVRAINSNVKVVAFKEKFTREFSTRVFRERVDCVVDTTDIPEMRFLVAEITYREKVPLVHAAAVRFTTTLTTIFPRVKSKPCLRCLYRDLPPAELRQTAARDGIFGPAAGLAGCLAAAEALKIIVYRDDPLRAIESTLCGRLAIFNSLDMSSRTIPYYKKEDCSLCSSIFDPDYGPHLLRTM